MLLNEKLKGRRLILASGSPRRKTLMEGCGLTFTVAEKYNVEEKYPTTIPSDEVPLFLAHLKSDNYPHQLADDEILITADTIVILEGQILGKPADHDEAVKMLRRLSGKQHTVVTGVVLRGTNGRHTLSVSTQVRFATLSAEQIDHYVSQCAPLDKAGSYAIQEWIGYVGIESIDGSFYNVMGLPTQQFCQALDDFTSGKNITLL